MGLTKLLQRFCLFSDRDSPTAESKDDIELVKVGSEPGEVRAIAPLHATRQHQVGNGKFKTMQPIIRLLKQRLKNSILISVNKLLITNRHLLLLPIYFYYSLH